MGAQIVAWKTMFKLFLSSSFQPYAGGSQTSASSEICFRALSSFARREHAIISGTGRSYMAMTACDVKHGRP